MTCTNPIQTKTPMTRNRQRGGHSDADDQDGEARNAPREHGSAVADVPQGLNLVQTRILQSRGWASVLRSTASWSSGCAARSAVC